MMVQSELSPSEKVGRNLKTLIKNSDFKTQDNFADKGMHVDPVTVRRWIAHGIKDINVIFDIAKLFGVEVMELFK